MHSERSTTEDWARDHFFQAGTTVQLDRKEPVEFSLLATYGIHTRKRGTDITVGNVVTLEGGLGYPLYKKQKMKHPIPIDVGIVYYAQFKVTPDKVNGAQRPVIQNLLAGHKDRVYGLGGELDYFIPKAGLVVGTHVLGELGARNRTQGVTGMFTIAYQVKSLVKSPPSSPEVAPERKYGSADTTTDPDLRIPVGVSR
jgi:hypothetical protein